MIINKNKMYVVKKYYYGSKPTEDYGVMKGCAAKEIVKNLSYDDSFGMFYPKSCNYAVTVTEVQPEY